MNHKENSQTLSYIVSAEQQQADCLLAANDAWGTQAHVAGLGKIGVMSATEVKAVLQALEQIKQQAEAGKFPLQPSLGAQLTLEKLVTEQVGTETGGKIHTGRSRNDQVTTTQKLYAREQILNLLHAVLGLEQILLQTAQQNMLMVMPGYTHMQPAKPTTVGQWCLSYTDMLLRDIERLEQTHDRHNLCPLGAAESYGTSWPLDRLYVARLLAFDGVQEIPADAVGSRGEMEAEILSDCSLVMLHISKLAQDLLLMNTFESHQITLDDEVAEQMGKVTGSSIMPQKKNPDVLELARANASLVYGQLFQILEVLKSLPMGYNRDSRETKELVMIGTDKTIATVEQMVHVFESIQFDQDRMMQLIKDNYSMATDLADYVAQKFGLPYRLVYTAIGQTVLQLQHNGKKLYELTPAELVDALHISGISWSIKQSDLDIALDPGAAINRRNHIGGASQEQMDKLIQTRKGIGDSVSRWIEDKENKIKEAKQSMQLLKDHL